MLLFVAFLAVALASSHSEAPGTATSPRVDITDFYAFNSYEPGRGDYVTLSLAVNGMQDAFGGPNYFPLASDFVYNIHIDNTGDGVEDRTFQFVVGANYSGPFDAARGTGAGIAIPVPNKGGTRQVKVALAVVGPVSAANEGSLNYKEHYQVRVVDGPLRNNRDIDAGNFATNQATGGRMFRKPFDNVGTKTFSSNYQNYAKSFVHTANIPGCAFPARVFVGQRRDAFSVNLGQIFDLVNLTPAEELITDLPAQDPKFNVLARKSITTLSMEVHKTCLRGNSDGIIGAWASVNYLKHVGVQQRHTVGAQKNRLGNPLINEVFIGLTDKDAWNMQHPAKESQFLEYYEYPTLPEIIDILFGAPVLAVINSSATSIAPNNYPRVDIREVLLHGVPGVTAQTLIGTSECGVISSPPYADILRLNTNVAATPRAQQNSLGVAGGDNAGYPNGRRPGDDVIDIFLRVGMGVLCHAFPNASFTQCTAANAPIGNLKLTDRAPSSAANLDNEFPYLLAPLPGSLLPSDPIPANF